MVESFRRAKVIRRGDYDYFVHPLTDGVVPVRSELLAEAAKALGAMLAPEPVDCLLTAEAMGIPLVSALTLATGTPFLVARKRPYDLPGEVRVPYATGYAQGHLHVCGLLRGDRVAVVDDVLSGGGTVRALARAVRQANARLVKVVVLANKGQDLDALSAELGAPVQAVAEVRIADGALEVVG